MDPISYDCDAVPKIGPPSASSCSDDAVCDLFPGSACNYPADQSCEDICSGDNPQCVDLWA